MSLVSLGRVIVVHGMGFGRGRLAGREEGRGSEGGVGSDGRNVKLGRKTDV